MASANAFDFKLFKRLLEFTKAYRLVFYFVAFTAVILSGLAILRPYFLERAIDESIIPRDPSGLIYFIVIMIGVLVLEVLFQFSFIFYANWLGQHIIKDLRISLFGLMMRFKMKYFDTSSVGRLTTRAVNDIETISSIFSQGLFMIIADLLKMTAIATFMLYQSWRLSLIVFVILPVILIATRLFQRAMKVAFEEVRSQVANLNSFVQERITGMKIVQVFAREQTEYKQFFAINEKHKKAWIKTVWYNSIFFPIAEMASSVAIGLLVWFGGLNAAANGVITLGLVVAFIELAQMFFRPLRQIADKFNTLQMGMVAAKRVFEILDTKAHISNQGTQVLKNTKGAIVFKNVCFSYVEGEQVIKDISFTVQPGETIAIVGATGAGKSTIINLLNRFYEINSGDILIDGVSIKDYTLASLREQIGVVLQDVFLIAACRNMSQSKTGALIVIKRNNSLEFVKSSGDAMSVAVNQPILESIFYKNSPLHDGAMLIEGNTITATRVILPVSDDKKIPLRFGLRHRAAVGVSEKSDAVCLVVSEENGQISYLKDGDFVLYETLEQLTEIIHKDLS